MFMSFCFFFFGCCVESSISALVEAYFKSVIVSVLHKCFIFSAVLCARVCMFWKNVLAHVRKVVLVLASALA